MPTHRQGPGVCTVGIEYDNNRFSRLLACMDRRIAVAISERVREYARQIREAGFSPQEFLELVRLLQEHFKVPLVPDETGDEDNIWQREAKERFIAAYAEEDCIYDKL